MRFVFENGGRTGCLSMEALMDYMEMIGEGGAGEIWIDFSPSKSGRGQLFKTHEQMKEDYLLTMDSRKLGARYWAEGEAIEVASATEQVSKTHDANRI